MNMDKPVMHRQYGLSLIELMVALLLSSLLILGVTQIYIDNKRNYSFQQGQSDIMENARYSILLFEEELYRAGYRSRQDMGTSFAWSPATEGDCTFERGETLNYDVDDRRICLRYEPALPVVTLCSGETVTGSDNPYTRPPEVAIVELQVFNNTLFCNGTPLIENMEDIRLSFGVNEGDGTGETQKYTETPAADEPINSIRYAILLRSRSSNLADSNDNLVYRAWRAKFNAEPSATAPDRALYFALENTVTLRTPYYEEF